MGTIFKNVLLEDDTGGGCAVLTDIFGRGDPSPTGEIEIVCSVNHQKRDDYLFSFVGTGVLDGPMSCRLQIVYPFAIKIKATYGNEIFIFCFRTAEDVGPYKFDIILLYQRQTDVRR